MANEKIYLHEFVDIILQNRTKYVHHMTANWGPVGRVERKMLCFGVWATVGSTERWPQATNMWEYNGWDGIAYSFNVEFSAPSHQDKSLTTWWAEAANFRSGGYDRILIPAHYCPTIKENIASGRKGDVYYHEMVRTAPGQAKTYLDLMERHWLKKAESIGLDLCFAGRSSMINGSEVVNVWAMKDWETWANVEDAYEEDDEVARWRTLTQHVAIDWRNKLLAPSPLNPMNTGKIL